MTLFSDPAVGIVDPYLRRAYELAERGRGTTSPNPLVGCIVVREGAIVGEGYHEVAGGPHAEVAALDAAGELARGSHVYVTLEPCAHFGKTPPCTDRLITEGVAEVTIGMRDPSPEAGGGAEVLEAAGIRVSWASDPSAFEQQNEEWLTRLRLGRPFVRVKIALTLDGRPALAVSRRARITGAGGRAVTMRLRAQATAIAVGAATVAIDDPKLTVRDAEDVVSARTPMRIILSRTSVPSAKAALVQDGRGVVLVTSDVAPAERVAAFSRSGARVLTYPYRDGLPGALRAVAHNGVNDVLVEAGPALLSALWRDRLIDELVLITAGGMSGNAAPPLFLGRPDVSGSDLEPVFDPIEAGIVGTDAVTVWRPRVARD